MARHVVCLTFDFDAELVRGIETIRKLTGRAARGYRLPSWDLGPFSIELLLKHGFVYDSSPMGDDYTACADKGAVFCAMKTAVAEFAKRVPLATS